jgi:SAM-dependent methyltransferase
MPSPRDRFLENFKEALHSGRFVKMTLSEPTERDARTRNVYLRWVELKGGRFIQIVRHGVRSDLAENLPNDEAVAVMKAMLGSEFNRGYLFTTSGDWQWKGPGEGSLKSKRPSFMQAPAPTHDREKVRAVAGAKWLVALGVTAPDGMARPGMGDKLRQIEHFAEIFAHFAEPLAIREGRALRVADLGCGKGYLTFAIAEHFKRAGIEADVLGVERRPELVAQGNQIAEAHGMRRLYFSAGEIADADVHEGLDVLVALHACNTATDDALYLGIESGAALILAAPCCHQELRQQIASPELLNPILKHGILLERYAEMLTDSLRTLLLEVSGYRARVIEFISTEHTGRNLMITAEKIKPSPNRESALARFHALAEFHGVRTQRLASRLGVL